MQRKQDVDRLVTLFADILESSRDSVEPDWSTVSYFTHNNSAMDDLADTILSYNKPNQCDEIMQYMKEQIRFKYGFEANFKYTFYPTNDLVYIECEEILSDDYNK